MLSVLTTYIFIRKRLTVHNVNNINNGIVITVLVVLLYTLHYKKKKSK